MPPTTRRTRHAAILPRLCCLGLAFSVGLGASCKAPKAPPESLDERYLWVTESVMGRALGYFTFGDERDETILFVASVHGDEPAGTPLLETLIEKLKADPTLTAERYAVIVPLANPDGYAMNTRRNAHDIDINRNFPAQNFLQSPKHGIHPQTEPETQFLRQVVERFRPTGILTFHQEGRIVDFDGPATAWAYRLASVCDELVVRRLGARPGSLGSWAGTDLGIRVLTIELPRQTNDLEPDEAWEIYGDMLLEALR